MIWIQEVWLPLPCTRPQYWTSHLVCGQARKKNNVIIIFFFIPNGESKNNSYSLLSAFDVPDTILSE